MAKPEPPPPRAIPGEEATEVPVGAGNDDGSMRGILAKAARLIDGTEKPPEEKRRWLRRP